MPVPRTASTNPNELPVGHNRKRLTNPKSAETAYRTMTTWRCERPRCKSLWWMCSRSAVNTGLPLIRRRSTERAVSSIGNPNETTGMATATIVGAFCAPSRARALSRNPMNRLPQSPRKIVAGLKLKRRNPRMAPASAIVIRATKDDWLTRATTNTTNVENRADPAARPSKPSIRLNAFVMAKTQRTVRGNPTNQGNWCAPKTIGRSRMRRPPRNNIPPASAWTENFT